MTRPGRTIARAFVRLSVPALAATAFALAGLIAGGAVGALLTVALFPSSLAETVIVMTAMTGAVLGALVGIALVVQEAIEAGGS